MNWVKPRHIVRHDLMAFGIYNGSKYWAIVTCTLRQKHFADKKHTIVLPPLKRSLVEQAWPGDDPVFEIIAAHADPE